MLNDNIEQNINKPSVFNRIIKKSNLLTIMLSGFHYVLIFCFLIPTFFVF